MAPKRNWITTDGSTCSMGDLLAFKGYVNTSAPFNWHEHDYIWKGERRYHDFQPGNTKNTSCEYPRMWGQNGYPMTKDITDQMDGCRDSEFDSVLYNLSISVRSIKLMIISTEI